MKAQFSLKNLVTTTWTAYLFVLLEKRIKKKDF
jgi:hypothetical protein